MMSSKIEIVVHYRKAIAEDLAKLEWFGQLTPYRLVLQAEFERAQRNEAVYLVADIGHFPIGQVEADLVRYREQQVGYIFALRVLDSFQRQGVGSRLLLLAEQAIRKHGLTKAQLNVAKDNKAALALYRQFGYEVVGEEFDSWSYTTPEGEVQMIQEAEWVMQKSLKDERIGELC